MASTLSSTPPKGSVRNIISIFENQTVAVNSEPTFLIRRAKSMGSLAPKPTVIQRTVERIEPENNLELAQIEQQVRHLQNNLSNNYRTYSRENHIYYQNQIIFILTDLGNVETRNNPRTIDDKSELTEVLKRLSKKLNALLPSGETAVVTTTTKYDKYGMKARTDSFNEDVVVTTSRVHKFGAKSNSFEEKREIKMNKKEPVAERVEERVVVKRVEEVQKSEDDVDSPAVSVRNLKELFEKNTNEGEGKTEFGMTKISRKFMTFNSTADLKYVPYSQKFKTNLDVEFRGRESLKKENSLDVNGTLDIEDTSSSQQLQLKSDDEDKPGDMSPDSFDGSGNNSSSEGSDSEQTAKEYLDDE
ncbi:hypothetical protein Zmor_024294 [Zophobas morio]|uniref:Uncharacterized protein n=1 Tax=Zophobas morio TaxID=2755281 RepID=A0AA38M874_9CUCU|nr:hypothetical protein Zmor_024294 [Zophobas morio]